MKILRNLFLLVFTVAIFASCEKSRITPSNKCDHSDSQSLDQSTSSSSTSKSRPANGPEVTMSEENENDVNTIGEELSSGPSSTDVSGSGDDDRDGGDKRRKK